MEPLETAVFAAITNLENRLGGHCPDLKEIRETLFLDGLWFTTEEILKACSNLEDSGKIERQSRYRIKRGREELAILRYCLNCGGYHMRRPSDGKALAKSDDWVHDHSDHRNARDRILVVFLSTKDGQTSAKQLGLQIVRQ